MNFFKNNEFLQYMGKNDAKKLQSIIIIIIDDIYAASFCTYSEALIYNIYRLGLEH